MSTDNLVIVTAQPEFVQAALTELKQLDKRLTNIEELAPDVILCGIPDATAFMRKAAQVYPIFVRHLAPVQAMVDLTNDEQDIGKIAMTIASLPTFAQLERGVHFAVQSRFVQSDKSQRPYTSGRLNQTLASAFAEETGAVESIKKPQIVISVLCTTHRAYVGISPAEENLSNWPGGARHFAQTSEQISRAEFKLLEALEVFGLSLPSGGRALDLGAAPGGWTHLFLEAGMHVVAVDPAQLDPRVAKHTHLQHYRGYAEDYLGTAIRRHLTFDVIANDMRMDAREAARLLARASPCLRADGFVLSVFKLPHATREISPLTTLKEALGILKTRYGTVQARQLFHNRQEVTVAAAHSGRSA